MTSMCTHCKGNGAEPMRFVMRRRNGWGQPRIVGEGTAQAMIYACDTARAMNRRADVEIDVSFCVVCDGEGTVSA